MNDFMHARNSRWCGRRISTSTPSGFLGGAAVAAVVFAAVGVAGILLGRGIGALDMTFLFSTASRFPELAGIGSALVGSIWLAAIAAFASVPLGMGTALYLSEFAPRNRATRFVGSLFGNLAAVPSVVYGFVGLGLFARGVGSGASIFAGGLTLGALALPLVIAGAREALDEVPDGVRTSAAALGATGWQIVRGQVLPAAAPRIVGGIRAALVRTAGSTAPLLIIGTASFMTFVPSAPGDPIAALPVQVFEWTVRPQETFVALAAGASLMLVCFMLLVGLAVRVILPGGDR